MFIEVRLTFTGMGLGLLSLKLSSIHVLIPCPYKLRGSVPLSYTREIVLSTFDSIGLPKQDYGLHSLRAGGASAAANARVPERLFKRHVRWKSDKAKDGYIKDNVHSLLLVSLSLGI